MTRITQKFIKTLKIPEKGNKSYYDEDVVGFGVRITSNKTISFILRYVINKRERRYTIGKYPDYSAIGARERAVEIRGDITKGIDPLETKSKALKIPLLKDFAKDYINQYAIKNNRPRSVKEDEGLLDKHIIPNFGIYTITSITKRDIEKLHQSLKHIPYRANRILSLLSKMFNIAIEENLLKNNPVKGIKKYHEESRERWLSEDELSKLWQLLESQSNTQSTNIIKLLILTGARKTELLSAKWEQFDLDKKVWVKPASNTKQKKTHYCPINDSAISVLESMERKGDFLFPSPTDKSTHVKDVKTFWLRIRKEAGLDDVRIHDLRHTFASHLVNYGYNLNMVGKLLGHSSPLTTNRYSHHSNETLLEASNKFGVNIGRVKNED